ncbi:hypothetical protein HaLaN_28031, partial [Haematococcus lacustris]
TTDLRRLLKCPATVPLPCPNVAVVTVAWLWTSFLAYANVNAFGLSSSQTESQAQSGAQVIYPLRLPMWGCFSGGFCATNTK